MPVQPTHAEALTGSSYDYVKISRQVAYRNTTVDGDRRSAKSVAVPAAGVTAIGAEPRIAPQLAAAIAISRAFGTLTGPVTATFLNRYDSAGTQRTGSLERTLDYLDSATRAPSNPPEHVLRRDA